MELTAINYIRRTLIVIGFLLVSFMIYATLENAADPRRHYD